MRQALFVTGDEVNRTAGIPRGAHSLVGKTESVNRPVILDCDGCQGGKKQGAGTGGAVRSAILAGQAAGRALWDGDI